MPARVSLKVAPGASKESVDGWLGETLKVRVVAPPERGKANAAAEKIVALALGISPDDVSIISGHHSARKTIEIQGLSVGQIRSRTDVSTWT